MTQWYRYRIFALAIRLVGGIVIAPHLRQQLHELGGRADARVAWRLVLLDGFDDRRLDLRRLVCEAHQAGGGIQRRPVDAGAVALQHPRGGMIGGVTHKTAIACRCRQRQRPADLAGELEHERLRCREHAHVAIESI